MIFPIAPLMGRDNGEACSLPAGMPALVSRAHVCWAPGLVQGRPLAAQRWPPHLWAGLDTPGAQLPGKGPPLGPRNCHPCRRGSVQGWVVQARAQAGAMMDGGPALWAPAAAGGRRGGCRRLHCGDHGFPSPSACGEQKPEAGAIRKPFAKLAASRGLAVALRQEQPEQLRGPSLLSPSLPF